MICLVLSDIHANLAALDAVLRDAAPFDQIWCIGDVVGYGPDPNECIARLQEYDHICVAGNHDLAALGRLDVADFNADARQAAKWTREQLAPRSLAYLQSLPEQVLYRQFTLVHGSPRQPAWEYVLHSAVAAANFPQMETPCCFVGHTHAPVIFQEYRRNGQLLAEPFILPEGQRFPLGADRLIINPGSVGQPRDGDERAGYVKLSLADNRISYHRLPYDLSITQARMKAFGLPERLIARLSYGW